MDICFCLLGVNWVMLKSMPHSLTCWRGVFGKKTPAEILVAIPLYLMWSIWRERNGYAFEERELLEIWRSN